MNPSHEHAIRQAAVLTYHLASIERALAISEQACPLLRLTIERAITRTENIAADELTRCRRLIRGEY